MAVFEILLTAKAISWQWLCCQLLGRLAVKYGGWESAASSPRQPDGGSPRREEQQQEKVGLGKERVGGGTMGEATEKQKRKKEQDKKKAKCNQVRSGGDVGQTEGEIHSETRKGELIKE